MVRANGNRFSVYTSEEKTVLGVINELGSLTNNVWDELDSKTDLYGDHKGTWQGLNRPTMSEEGIRATVEDIVDNKIPSIETSLKTSLETITLGYDSYAMNKTKTKLKNKEPLKIVCHGTSMTYGYNTDGVQSINNYPKVLQEKLRYIYDYDDITVINEGHSGCDTKYALSNFKTQVLDHSPDLLIMEWGLNDAGVGDVDLNTFTSNMRNMIIQAKSKGIEVIIATQVPIISRTLGLMYDLENKNYTNAMEKLALEQCVEFVDVYDEFRTLFKNNIISSDDYDSSHHLKDYSIVADIILVEKLSEIYTSKFKDGDFIRFDSNLIYNSITEKGKNTNSVINMFYNLDSTKPNEKIRVLFYNNIGNVNLKVFTWDFSNGGNVVVKNYGNTLTTLNNYSSTHNPLASKSINLTDIGLYCIEFNASDVEPSKIFVTSGLQIVKNVNIAPSTYIDLTLQNNWVNNGSNFTTARVTNVDNLISVTGLIKSGVAADGTVITQLPTGYRPSSELLIPVTSWDNTNCHAGFLRVKTDGSIIAYLGIKSGLLSLDTIKFTI